MYLSVVKLVSVIFLQEFHEAFRSDEDVISEYESSWYNIYIRNLYTRKCTKMCSYLILIHLHNIIVNRYGCVFIVRLI